MARQYDRMVRAVLAAGALAIGIALAAVVAAAVRAGGAAPWVSTAAPAVTTLVTTLALLAALGARLPARSGALRAAALGFGAVVVAGAAAFGVDALAGGTRVLAVRPGALVGFLLLNAVVALALEAVPEEFALRGAAFGALSARGRTLLAGIGTTALFVVTPAAGLALAAGLGHLVGLPTPPATFAPGGQDPVAYAVLLAVFGTMLVAIRVATASVWACVGAHLAFLTVNRIALDPTGERSGVAVALPADGEVLVLVYAALVAVGCVLVTAAGAARRRGVRAEVRGRS